MYKKAILFDLFGTLVEIKNKTNPYKLLAQRINYDKKNTIDLINDVLTNNYLLLPISTNIDENILKEFYDNLNLELDSICYFKGVQKMLETLKMNFDLYLISNVSTAYKNYVKNQLGINKYFNKLYFSCDYGMRKPDVNFFNIIIDEIKYEKENIIMVGDSYNSDIMGAKNAGIKYLLKNSDMDSNDVLNILTNYK
jgi:putative hydrolase of the HAD superfamily